MKSFTLLLAAAGVSSSEAFAINHRSSLQSAKRSGSTLYASTDAQSSALKEALKLREKAAKVRADDHDIIFLIEMSHNHLFARSEERRFM